MAAGPVEVHARASEAMRRAAADARRDEACGYLIGQGRTVRDMRRTANLHDEPHRRFTVDPKVFLDLEDELEGTADEVVGIFHSHPRSAAAPSATDRAHAQPGWIYVILGFPDGAAEDAPGRPATGRQVPRDAGELRAWVLDGGDFLELPTAILETSP